MVSLEVTGDQMAAALSTHLGETVAFNSVTPETYRGFGFPGADDLGNMFQFYSEFEDYFCGVRDLDEVRRFNPELKSFDDWLAANAGRIPID